MSLGFPPYFWGHLSLSSPKVFVREHISPKRQTSAIDKPKILMFFRGFTPVSMQYSQVESFVIDSLSEPKNETFSAYRHKNESRLLLKGSKIWSS